MALQIDVMDETAYLTDDHIQLINNLLIYAYQNEGIEEDAEVSVTLVDNQKIQEYNRDYRGIDRPTDVLSFALEESGEGELTIQGLKLPRVLGDIIISIDKVTEQARDFQHSFERELGFLAVHGFLHLLGYDHMEENDEKRMFARQNEILQGYGLER